MTSQISIAAADASKAEGLTGSTPFTFTLTRTGDVSLAQAVVWNVAGSGTSPADANDFPNAQLPSGVVSFGAGESSKTLTVNVKGDSTVENDEGFTVNLSSPTNGATLGTASASGTILNDDAGSVSIGPVTLIEGGPGTTTQAIFTVTRTGGTAPFTLDYNTADGTATVADNDYDAASGTLTFAAGVNSQTIAVTVNGDSKYEPGTVKFGSGDETFSVNISHPTGNTVTLKNTTANGTIDNDDNLVAISQKLLGVTEGNSGSQAVVFTAELLLGEPEINHAINWTVTGTGPNPVTANDFVGGVLPSGTIVIPGDIDNNSSALPITAYGTFYVQGDTTAEANEGFTITFTPADNDVQMLDSTENGIIADDDHPASPTVMSLVAADNESVLEGDGTKNSPVAALFGYGVTRNGDLSQAQTVIYTVTGSGAHPASADDFQTSMTGTISFAAGQAFAPLNITATMDTVFEPDEGFTVTLSNPSGGATLNNATGSGTILNDDIAIGDVTVSNASVTEGGDLVFTVTRTGGTGAFTLGYVTADGTAVGDKQSPGGPEMVGDYQPVSGSLNFAAGVNTKTITVHTNSDQTVEPDETLLLKLSSSTPGVNLITSQATGTIINDDVPGTFSIGDASVIEGNAGTSIYMTFTVTLAGGNTPATVQYATADGTATSASGDYDAQTGTLSFNKNGTATIRVLVHGDNQAEADENFSVILLSPTNSATISDAQGVGTILNDDVSAPITASVSVSDATVTEGNNGLKQETFTVTRSGDEGPFSVEYATYDRSATVADQDYAPAEGTLHFLQGVNTMTFSVAVIGDTKVESDENFGVKLLNPTNGVTIADRTGAGFILNDDVSGSVSVSDATVTEGDNGTQLETFTVTRSGGTAPFAIGYSTYDRSATAADGDYDPTAGTLNFAAGVNTLTFSVIVNGDTKAETDENFGVKLLDPTNGITIADRTGAGFILNDDAPLARDFNGDGKSDILLRNDSGDAAIWQLNGTTTVSRTWTSAAPGTSWHIVSTADFNQDSKSDLLLQNDNGQIAIWDMDGATRLSSTTLADDPGSAWHVVTTGDFNGDEKSDILLRNDDGRTQIWLMNGSAIASETTLASNPGPTWHIAGAGDFNGDGKSDIVWQNDSGQVVIWTMNGGSIAANTTVATNPGPTWHVDGTGDFNGDGKSDIVLQNDNGQVAIWLMNGGTLTSRTVLGTNPGPGWQVKGTGDYNGDGKSDILLQNTNGNAAVLLMSGASITATGSVGGTPGPTWHVIGG